MKTAIYCVAWSARGPAKVGIADSPVDRLSELQVGNPYRLQIYSAIVVRNRDAAFLVEQTILQEMFPCRLVGEWLRLPPARLRDLILSTCKRFGLGVERWVPSESETVARMAQLQPRRSNKRAELAYREARDLHEELGGRIAVDSKTNNRVVLNHKPLKSHPLFKKLHFRP